MKYLLLLVILIGFSIYAMINYSNYGKILGKNPVDNIALTELLPYANLYDGKNLCTRGIYVQGNSLSIIKVNLNDDKFTKSIWVKVAPGNNLIIDASGSQNRAVEAKICGYFESHRGGDFGEPSIWNHQLTVKTFDKLGESFSHNY